MRHYVHRYMRILWLMMLCACYAVPLSSCREKQLKEHQVIPRSTTTLSYSQSLEVNTVSDTAEILSFSSKQILRTDLECSIYVESKWGNGPGELGRCSSNFETINNGPFLPVLDMEGNLFVFDQVNRRVLMYEGNTLSQVISVPPSYGPSNSCKYIPYGWSNVDVDEDKLFLFFASYKTGQQPFQQQLAILPIKGQDTIAINLAAYAPLRSVSNPIADRQGGVYVLLPPAAVVHFDADFQSEFMYVGEDDWHGYRGLAIGWDGNTYTYRVENDLLSNWGPGNNLLKLGVEPQTRYSNIIAASKLVTPTEAKLLGADVQGQLYFMVSEQIVKRRLIRISASGEQYKIASIDDKWLLPFYTFTLAPDGSLYSIIYDSKNPTINPQIIKCIFEE